MHSQCNTQYGNTQCTLSVTHNAVTHNAVIHNALQTWPPSRDSCSRLDSTTNLAAVSTQKHTHTHTHAHIHLLTHTHTHIYIHKHTHTHMHTLTHQHKNHCPVCTENLHQFRGSCPRLTLLQCCVTETFYLPYLWKEERKKKKTSQRSKNAGKARM